MGVFVLVPAELAVPVRAERRDRTTWHPHHIAERYGLFTIIVLGECVLAVTIAIEPQAAAHLLAFGPVIVAGAGLVLLFALWWMYFLKPAGAGLAVPLAALAAMGQRGDRSTVPDRSAA